MFSKRWVSTTTLRGDGTVAKGANAVAAGAADAAVAMPARCADTARRAPTTRFGKDSVDSGTMLEPPGLDESACLASWPLRLSSTSALAQQLLCCCIVARQLSRAAENSWLIAELFSALFLCVLATRSGLAALEVANPLDADVEDADAQQAL